MKIRAIYSACVSIETEDCTILCDPWWSPAYEGAWVQWPPWASSIEQAVQVLGEAQFIFVSHTHPDHFDMALLKAYLAAHPNARVLIAEQNPDLLGRKLRSRGIEPLVGGLRIGKTSLTTYANRANIFNIDSALVVTDTKHAIVNLNDNPLDEKQLDKIKQFCSHGITVALLPFVGAGPWPQCYHFENPADQLKATEAKKQKYLDLFARYCQILQPKVAVPFAGQYWLHGPQLDLNPLRGMADATECVPYWKHVWVPEDGGQATMELDSSDEWTISGERYESYDWPTVRKRLAGQDPLRTLMSTSEINRLFDDDRLRYEREIQVPVERLPLLKLLQSAVRNIWREFRDKRPVAHIYIKTQLPHYFHLITDSGNVGECEQPWECPRVEVTLDARLLFGMLTRLYNANSVRIGSLCRFKCVPNVYDKELDDLFGEWWDSLRV